MPFSSGPFCSPEDVAGGARQDEACPQPLDVLGGGGTGRPDQMLVRVATRFLRFDDENSETAGSRDAWTRPAVIINSSPATPSPHPPPRIGHRHHCWARANGLFGIDVGSAAPG
jgi:hypothetical protein